MCAQPYQNHWKQYHESLHPDMAKERKAAVEWILCISQAAFYRKLKEPDRYLTIAEKLAIARAYRLRETYLFPELLDEPKLLLI